MYLVKVIFDLFVYEFYVFGFWVGCVVYCLVGIGWFVVGKFYVDD